MPSPRHRTNLPRLVALQQTLACKPALRGRIAIRVSTDGLPSLDQGQRSNIFAGGLRNAMTASFRLALVCSTLITLGGQSASAQTALSSKASASRWSSRGRMSARNAVRSSPTALARNRTTFDFATKDGQIVSFSGNGAQQEATEESDPLQPINVVSESKAGSDVGAPVFSPSAPAASRRPSPAVHPLPARPRPRTAGSIPAPS